MDSTKYWNGDHPKKPAVVRYIVAWLPANDSLLMASIAGHQVGRQEGWYRLVYDDEFREAYDGGPYANAEAALQRTQHPS